MSNKITPAGHVWKPVPVYSECPCGIDRNDCTYHKPERKPIKAQKITTVVIDGKEYIKGQVYESVEILLTPLTEIIDPELFADHEKANTTKD